MSDLAPVSGRAPSLASIGALSPVLQLIAVDSPDGMVCGIDGVCAVPGEAVTADAAAGASVGVSSSVSSVSSSTDAE